jgi:hypothetical protein
MLYLQADKQNQTWIHTHLNFCGTSKLISFN